MHKQSNFRNKHMSVKDISCQSFPKNLKRLPSHTNNTSSHQLLDLHPHLRVLHVFLQRGGITLRLLEDALHNGVLENGHDLDKILA